MTRTDGDGPTAGRARLEERALPHRRLIRAGPGVLFSPIWQSRSSCPSRPQAARRGLCARPEESETGSEPGGVTSLSPFAQPVASPPLGVVSDRSADLPCRGCGSRRCVCCRPDPRRPASAPGSRSRGRAATLVDADLAPGPDDLRERGAERRPSPRRDWRCGSGAQPGGAVIVRPLAVALRFAFGPAPAGCPGDGCYSRSSGGAMSSSVFAIRWR
jgi:hypothetical protein